MNREAREKKEKEVNAQTDQYMQNALSSLRSLSGNVKSKEIEEKPLSEVSKVADDFFMLVEMDAFLDDQDAKENRKAARQEKGLPEEDDENLDLFGDDWNGGDEEARLVTFKDFQVNDEKEAIGSKTVNEESDSNSENEVSNENDTGSPDTGIKRLLSEDEEEDLGEVKSTHELRQLRLKKKIKKMEQEAVGQVEGLEKDGRKMWQMKGEITAVDRPENSLLQEHLEYDTVSKQAPVITEQVSKRLEDIIMHRIKDQAYDDVQRGIKPIKHKVHVY
jgi:U3 small nucleolar RNA-associated protein MPP10